MARDSESVEFVKLTPQELAVSGWRVYNKTLSRTWAYELVRANFEAAATQAHPFILEASSGDVGLDPRDLASKLYSWAFNGDISSLPEEERFAWETVGRHWFSCLTSESGGMSMGEMESYAIEWAKQRMQKPEENGKATRSSVRTEGNPNYVQNPILPAHEPAPVPNNGVSRGEAARMSGPLYEQPPPKPSGAANGFRNIIQIKIDQKKREIEALEKLKVTISQEVDGALFEIFKEVMAK